MTTTIQELKDQIELDVLRRINDLEHELSYLRNKVHYDSLSKSERMREKPSDGGDVRVYQDLIAELKLQHSLLQDQVNELRALLINCKERAMAEKSKKNDDGGYW
jgi:hypothetical protein